MVPDLSKPVELTTDTESSLVNQPQKIIKTAESNDSWLDMAELDPALPQESSTAGLDINSPVNFTSSCLTELLTDSPMVGCESSVSGSAMRKVQALGGTDNNFNLSFL